MEYFFDPCICEKFNVKLKIILDSANYFDDILPASFNISKHNADSDFYELRIKEIAEPAHKKNRHIKSL